jgi:hypothetical protein
MWIVLAYLTDGGPDVIDAQRKLARLRADWKGTNGPEARERAYAYSRRPFHVQW